MEFSFSLNEPNGFITGAAAGMETTLRHDFALLFVKSPVSQPDSKTPGASNDHVAF
jgi:hypothetical protein